MAIQRLTAAYRSRSRPSSTLGAKASTMCPYYLDGDLNGRGPKSSPGDTRFIGYCAVFKVREEAVHRATTQGPKPSERRRHAGLSKLNSMRPRSRCANGTERPGCQIRSTCLVTECAQSLGRGKLRRAPGRPSPAFGALAMEGSLERR